MTTLTGVFDRTGITRPQRALLVVAAAALCASLGCAQRYSIKLDGPAGTGPDAELAIQEMLVRNLVAEEPPGAPVLVSFGEWPAQSFDPPAGFLARLSNVAVSLQPVSQFKLTATPNAVLVAIHTVQWASETEASVAVTRVRFGVGASDGFTARVERASGAWRVVGTSGHWNT